MGDPWRIGLLLGAVANLANAAWMLVDPAGWYLYLPAAVPDTGPFNAHFVRDVGSAFAVMGLALACGALRPALVHVADTVAGRLPASHWWIDLPGVYVPALVMLGVTALAARTAPRNPA